MDHQTKLDDLVAYIQAARAMPMSVSVLVNRTELLELVAEVRETLPAALAEAEFVLADRDEVVAEGERAAAELVAEVEQERARLVDSAEIVVQARREAERIVAEGESQAAAMRRDVDEYVDTKLANFEVVLDKTLRVVAHGRDKLVARADGGRGDMAELAALSDPENPSSHASMPA